LFAPHIYGVVLRAHSVRGEPRIQRNASGEVATVSWFSAEVINCKILLRELSATDFIVNLVVIHDYFRDWNLEIFTLYPEPSPERFQ